MRDSIVGRIALLALVGAMAGSCAPPDPYVVSLKVTPTSTSMAPGTTERFTAIATYNDGSTGDVTDMANWHSTQERVVYFRHAGEAYASGPGTASVFASYDSASDTA